MLPHELVNDYSKRKCVLFVGAGVSSRSVRADGTRPPNWIEFVRQLIEFAYKRDYFDDNGKQDLQKMLSENKSIPVAQIVIDELKQSEFQSFLDKVFHGLEPNDPIYPLICSMFFRAIVTTNFDTLIEDAFQRFAPQKIKAWTQNDISENLCQIEQEFLLKLHGTYERQGTVVLGVRSYFECLYKNQVMQELMESLLLTNTFLFIGYSMSDPDINELVDFINTVSNGNGRNHYLAVEKGRISILERRYLRRHRNIVAIEYENNSGSHEGILDLLGELKKKTNP